MPTSEKKRPQRLSSVTNALRVLKSFSTFEPNLRVSELSESLGLSKSTISRLLSTLHQEGFVVKDKDGSYRLGLSVLTLAGIVTNELEIHKEASPVMNELVSQTGETAHLSILTGLDTIYIHKEECNHPVKILTHLGRKNPAQCTSSGKVLLAFDENDVVEEIIENGLPAYTDKSITDPAILRREMENIRQNGYAVSTEELTKGTRSISAPIRDYTGKVVAAINIVGPLQRLKDFKIKQFAKHVVQAGEDASERLGYDKRFLG